MWWLADEWQSWAGAGGPHETNQEQGGNGIAMYIAESNAPMRVLATWSSPEIEAESRLALDSDPELCAVPVAHERSGDRSGVMIAGLGGQEPRALTPPPVLAYHS